MKNGCSHAGAHSTLMFLEMQRSRVVLQQAVESFSASLPSLPATVAISPPPPLPPGLSEHEPQGIVNRAADKRFRRTHSMRGRAVKNARPNLSGAGTRLDRTGAAQLRVRRNAHSGGGTPFSSLRGECCGWPFCCVHRFIVRPLGNATCTFPVANATACSMHLMVTALRCPCPLRSLDPICAACRMDLAVTTVIGVRKQSARSALTCAHVRVGIVRAACLSISVVQTP